MSAENFLPTESNNEPIAQQETVALLRQTIARLQGIIDNLDEQSLEQLPIAVVTSLASTTEQIAIALNPASVALIDDLEENLDSDLSNTAQTTEQSALINSDAQKLAIAEDKDDSDWMTPTAIETEDLAEDLNELPSWWDHILPSFNKLLSWWDQLLRKVRSFLPDFVNQKLNDWALTAIISGLVVITLLSSVILVSKPTTEVAELPPLEITQPDIEVPPELSAPEQPQIVPLEPLPEVELTPEQNLVAAIKEQVTTITNQYAEGLIVSINASFMESKLIVTVSDKWYQLRESRQNQMANDILARSRQLDFKKLEINHENGDLVARQPVIGQKMVIVQRIKES